MAKHIAIVRRLSSGGSRRVILSLRRERLTWADRLCYLVGFACLFYLVFYWRV